MTEDQYAQLYKQLSPSDQEQINSATTLRAFKAAEDSEVEALRNDALSSPGDVERDLSERMSLGAIQNHRAVSAVVLIGLLRRTRS